MAVTSKCNPGPSQVRAHKSGFTCCMLANTGHSPENRWTRAGFKCSGRLKGCSNDSSPPLWNPCLCQSHRSPELLSRCPPPLQLPQALNPGWSLILRGWAGPQRELHEPCLPPMFREVATNKSWRVGDPDGAPGPAGELRFTPMPL
jgi:hypothetical protein